jgi:hypothetical protein
LQLNIFAAESASILNKLMKYIFSLTILILYSVLTIGQTRQVIDPVPKPYNYSYSLTKDHGIKRIIWLNANKNGNIDTTAFTQYNPDGKETEIIVYSGGKRFFHQKKVYPTDTNLVKSKRIDPATGKVLTEVQEWHNKFKKIDRVQEIYLKDTDTTARVITQYQYDTEGNLEKMESSSDGIRRQYNCYYYEGQKLIRRETFSGLGAKSSAQVDYTYTSDGTLKQKTEYRKTKTKTGAIKITNYKFSDNKLINENYQTGSYPDKFINISYEYESLSRIHKITAKQDSLYKIINYEYQGNKLIKISAIANGPNIFPEGLAITGTSPLTKFPVRYELNFKYDDQGNIIEVKVSVDGEVIATQTAQIQYFTK